MNDVPDLRSRRLKWCGRFARLGAVAAIGATLLVAPGSAALPSAQTVPCGDLEPAPLLAPAASPVSSPAPASAAATPISVNAGAAAQIELLVRTIAACQSQRRVKTLTHLVSERFLGDVYAGGGSISVEQFIQIGRTLPDLPVTVVSVSDIQIDGAHATADVVTVIGHQLTHARWSFGFKEVESGDNTGNEIGLGVWIAERVKALPVAAPAGADALDLTIVKNAYDPATLEATGPDVVLAATNKDKVDHELFVVALAKGVTTRDILAAPGPQLPEGVTVIGQMTVPARGDGRLVLVDLAPGTYTIVDLLPSSDGAPYLAHGMEATLTVR